jgi:protein tyrosine/serine phosphatase
MADELSKYAPESACKCVERTQAKEHIDFSYIALIAPLENALKIKGSDRFEFDRRNDFMKQFKQTLMLLRIGRLRPIRICCPSWLRNAASSSTGCPEF